MKASDQAADLASLKSKEDPIAELRIRIIPGVEALVQASHR